MGKAHGWVVLTTAVSFLYGSTMAVGVRVFAAEMASPVSASQVLIKSSTDVQGRVLFPDGETPAAKVKIKIWSVEQKKVVQEIVTDENGNYTLKGLPPGQYQANYGNRVQVNMLSSSADNVPPLKFLNVMVPQAVPANLLPVMLLAIAGGIVAIAVPIAVGAGGGGGHVSP